MFTGIITDIGTVRGVEKRGDTRFILATGYDTASIAIGASIACSGACMTMVEKGPGWFAIDVSDESLSRTTMGGWQEGTRVNLERALRMGDELGGHLVTGHVDGVGEVMQTEARGGSLHLVIAPPASLLPYMAEKGSLTVDGVSLTINRAESSGVELNLIPHTQAATTLGALSPGARVNLEADLIARYVRRLLPDGGK